MESRLQSMVAKVSDDAFIKQVWQMYSMYVSGFAASVYVNDVFIRTTYGNSTSNRNIISETTEWYPFPNGVLIKGENVLTIVQVCRC